MLDLLLVFNESPLLRLISFPFSINSTYLIYWMAHKLSRKKVGRKMRWKQKCPNSWEPASTASKQQTRWSNQYLFNENGNSVGWDEFVHKARDIDGYKLLEGLFGDIFFVRVTFKAGKMGKQSERLFLSGCVCGV